MRGVWLYLALAGALTTLGVAAQSGVEVRGVLSANETERTEGYFAIAQDTVLMVRPGSDMHRWLSSQAGKTVRLVVEPAATR